MAAGKGSEMVGIANSVIASWPDVRPIGISIGTVTAIIGGVGIVADSSAVIG